MIEPTPYPTCREESERAVLGAAIHGGDDNACAARLRPQLPPDAFVLPAHVTIWQAICDLVDLGRPVDAVTLSDELKAQGRYDQVGGAAYLDTMIDAIPYRLDLDGHVAILLDAMRGRRWLSADRRAVAALREGRPIHDVQRLADEAAAHLLAAEPERDRGDCVADVLERGVSTPVRFEIAGRGTESGCGTDLGHMIGSLYPGQIALVAGPTGAGKTALLLALALVGARAGMPIGFIGLEDTAEELEVRLAAALSWVDIWRIQSRRWADPTEPGRVAAAVAQIRALPLWIRWLPGGNATDVGCAIRELVHRHHVAGVAVDYVQAITGGRDEYEGIRASLGTIERAAGRDVGVYLGSQVNREGTKSGSPEAHHMRGAGTLEERARKVVVVSRMPRQEHETGDDGKPHLARREVKIAVLKNKGEEGEVFGFVHRMKGIIWPGYAPPPWVPDAPSGERQSPLRPYDDGPPVPDDGDNPWGG